MIFAMILGLAIGVALGFVFTFSYPTEYAFYITMGLLAAIDSLLGAARAQIEGKYSNLVFISGFMINALLAAALTYLGDRLGVPLYYAAILVFGGRLFNNLAIIRHLLIDHYRNRKSKTRRKIMYTKHTKRPAADKGVRQAAGQAASLQPDAGQAASLQPITTQAASLQPITTQAASLQSVTAQAVTDQPDTAQAAVVQTDADRAVF